MKNEIFENGDGLFSQIGITELRDSYTSILDMNFPSVRICDREKVYPAGTVLRAADPATFERWFTLWLDGEKEAGDILCKEGHYLVRTSGQV